MSKLIKSLQYVPLAIIAIISMAKMKALKNNRNAETEQLRFQSQWTPLYMHKQFAILSLKQLDGARKHIVRNVPNCPKFAIKHKNIHQ